MKTNKVGFAGDVDVQDAIVITANGFAINVKNQIAGLEIYEDLFSPFITGKIFIRDSLEIINLLPLVGEEVIRLSVVTPSLDKTESYSGDFFIYKLDDRIKTAERELVYVIHFISKEAVYDLNKHVSKAFSGKLSDIAREIITGGYGLVSPKPALIEETKNTTKFVSNWWTPTQCMQLATESALSKTDSPSYIFFETKYGFNFTSLETLYKSAIKQTFVWDNYTRELDTMDTGTRDITKDYQRILEIDNTKGFDYIQRLKSGMFGSELITYDILTKQYTHVAYRPTFDPAKSLNQYPLWSDQSPTHQKAVMMFEPKYYNNFDGYGDVTNTRFVMQRKSLLTQAEADKITITVFGRTDYSVGQKVEIKIPKNAQIKQEDNPLDQLVSGNYLISALCHLITRDGHKCIMELIKDSYAVSITSKE